MADTPDLRAPAAHTPTLFWLAELSEPRYDAALQSLSEAAIDRRAIIQHLETVDGWDRDRALALINMLESISDVQRLLAVTSAVIGQSVSRSVDVAPESQDRLAGRIKRLLESDVIHLMARGRELATEREHVLDDARILSDLRPLFTPGTEDSLDGAVILHSLRLRYAGSAEPALHIALDKAHLNLLQHQITRALRKAEHLEQRLTEMGIRYIEPDPLVQGEERP